MTSYEIPGITRTKLKEDPRKWYRHQGYFTNHVIDGQKMFALLENGAYTIEIPYRQCNIAIYFDICPDYRVIEYNPREYGGHLHPFYRNITFGCQLSDNSSWNLFSGIVECLPLWASLPMALFVCQMLAKIGSIV